MPYFLDYYRKLGVRHFILIDNESTDGLISYVAQASDISVWTTSASYKQANFGLNWTNYLLSKYGSNHWCLTVDPDEFLVYPYCDTRSLAELTTYLDLQKKPSLGTMLVDMYSDRHLSETLYIEGTDPLTICPWFDPIGYTERFDPVTAGTWIQGGPRRRAFFKSNPTLSPSMNKTPLIKWRRSFAYLSSTHAAAPARLNIAHGERIEVTGALLHFKFLASFIEKMEEEEKRQQHFGQEYAIYRSASAENDPMFWTPESRRYHNWQSLVRTGIITRADWF